MLTVFRTNPKAKIPKKIHQHDAGWDLFYNGETPTILLNDCINQIPTGIGVVIPEGFVGLILDKSGRALSGWKVVGGVIDSSYRGEIKVLLDTRESVFSGTSEWKLPKSSDYWCLEPGSKIAQLLIIPCDTSTEVCVLDSCPDTTIRGTSGFGSTGNF